MLTPAARRLPLALSLGAALVALTAAVAGLADLSLYRPTTPERLLPGAASQDLLTVVVSVGIAVCAWRVRGAGGERLWLVWVGLVGYLVYAYALYAFERVYNPLFLAYVAVLGLSLYALIAFFSRAELERVRPRDGRGPPPRRAVAALLLILLVLFLTLWMGILLPAMARREPPEGSAIFVLDLSFFLPLLGLEAVLLLRRRPLGDALAVPILVKVGTLGTSVLVGTLLTPLFGRELVWGEALTYAVMGLLPLALLVPFYRRLAVAG